MPSPKREANETPLKTPNVNFLRGNSGSQTGMFDFAAITPEGVTGAHLSPDGRNVAVTGPNGK